MVRGNLATIFDGLFPASDARSVEPQVLLDMLLLELDRGIDLLALGAEPGIDRPTEIRAVAYWLIVRVILELLLGQYIAAVANRPRFPASLAGLLPAATGSPLAGPIATFAAGHVWFEQVLIHRLRRPIMAQRQRFRG